MCVFLVAPKLESLYINNSTYTKQTDRRRPAYRCTTNDVSRRGAAGSTTRRISSGLLLCRRRKAIRCTKNKKYRIIKTYVLIQTTNDGVIALPVEPEKPPKGIYYIPGIALVLYRCQRLSVRKAQGHLRLSKIGMLEAISHKSCGYTPDTASTTGVL